MSDFKLMDLYFNGVDAENEYEVFTPNIYKDIFLKVEAFRINDFLIGNKRYLYGDKGTGKTAIFKYIQSITGEENTLLIRYDRDINRDEKRKIKEKNIKINSNSNIDNRNMDSGWIVFFIKQLLVLDKNRKNPIFKHDQIFEKILEILDNSYSVLRDNIENIFPDNRRNNIIYKIAKAQLDNGKDDKISIDFNIYFTQILGLFSSLKIINKKEKFYIMIDELELLKDNSKQFQNDVRLLTSLIWGIENFNKICKEKKLEIYTMTALRTEVYDEVFSDGKELNKVFSHAAIEIDWRKYSTADINKNPLIQLIENRFKTFNNNDLRNNENIWINHFEPINGEDPKKYILKQTWYKPRDIVRWFTCVIKKGKESNRITNEMVNNAKSNYSIECWNEVVQSLRVKFKKDEIEIIALLLRHCGRTFSLQYFKEKREYLATIDNRFTKFVIKNNVLLEILYKLNVIGNVNPYNEYEDDYFYYRDKKILNFELNFKLHTCLIHFFK